MGVATEAAAVVEHHVVPSAHYAGGVPVSVLLPAGYAASEGRHAVLYLLHGSEDDAGTWLAKTRVEDKVGDLVVVMPDAMGRSFYLDSPGKGAWQSFFVDELLPWVDARYRTVAAREGRCVAGNSMGGYGALRLGWVAPERFAAVASMSGAVSWGEDAAWRDHGWVSRVARDLYGDEAREAYARDALRPLLRARVGEGGYDGPALYLDVGRGDFLRDDNRAFHAELEAMGVPHAWAEAPGGHDWRYWDARVGDIVAFCKAQSSR